MNFPDALSKFQAEHGGKHQELSDDVLERELRRESQSKCDCGKPVAVLHSGAPCVKCKSCIAVAMTGDLDALL